MFPAILLASSGCTGFLVVVRGSERSFTGGLTQLKVPGTFHVPGYNIQVRPIVLLLLAKKREEIKKNLWRG